MSFKGIGVAVAIGAAVLSSAPPVSADPFDDYEFLGDLDRNGMWYQNRNQIISYAHGVCYDLDQGIEQIRIADRVLAQNPGFGEWANASMFTVLAVYNYCPWYRP